MNETVNKAFTREGRLCMEPNRLPGKLITFCGLDGCGKTTMIHRLDAWLRERGDRVALTKQPTDFVRKSAIFRTYMDCPEHDAYDYRSLSLLAASDRVQHSNRVIRLRAQKRRHRDQRPVFLFLPGQSAGPGGMSRTAGSMRWPSRCRSPIWLFFWTSTYQRPSAAFVPVRRKGIALLTRRCNTACGSSISA